MGEGCGGIEIKGTRCGIFKQRIEDRQVRLVHIVFGMLARLVPVVRPRDATAKQQD